MSIPRRSLPTLSEVSNLFEEFYYFVQYYSWGDDEEKIKRTFMKTLEKFARKNISIVDVKKVRNFLQKEIFVISTSVNDASIDYDIFNRYNFIVNDLIKRKVSINTNLQEKLTTIKPPTVTVGAGPDRYEKQNYFQHSLTTTTTTRSKTQYGT